jgi:glycosyltransferase involved in cell wall biosynthesis
MNAAALSVLVVAHNEEAHLDACLATASFANEIVVVLDRCTDRSREIALAHSAKLVEGSWPNEGTRRRAGIEAAAGPWILELDADERLPPALAAEIGQRLASAEPGIFNIPFRNFIGDRPVLHGWGAYNGVGSKACLFAKGMKLWGDELVHPKVQLFGPRARLDNSIDHYVDADLDDMFARLNRYTTLAARQLVLERAVPTKWKTARRVIGRFYKSYCRRQGYKEGHYGLALALFSALYPLISYLKARVAVREGRT